MSAAGRESDSHRGRLDHRALALTVAALAAFGLAYRDLWTFGPDYELSAEVEYFFFIANDSAPLVVLALAVWLLWRRLPQIRLLRPTQPTGWPLAFALGSLALGLGWTFWARFTQAGDLLTFSLVLNGLGIATLIFGTPGLRVFRLPVLFMLFCIPIPAPTLLPLIWNMQLITAEYADWLLFLLGETAVVSGDQILRPRETFQVIEGCSGLRSVQTLTMLIFVQVDLFGRRGLHALTLVVLAPIVAFALNGLRVLTLILNPHSEVIGVHTTQGIVILLVGLTLLYLIDGQLERWIPESAPRTARLPRGQVAGWQLGTIGGTALATLALAHLGPIYKPELPQRTLNASAEAAFAEFGELPVERDYSFSSSARFDQRVYANLDVGGVPVEVFIGTANQRLRLGSPFSPTTAFPGSGWSTRLAEPHVLEPGDVPVTRRVIQKQSRSLLVYHWYAGNRGIFVESVSSLIALHRSPLRNPKPGYVARLSTVVNESAARTVHQSRVAADRRLQRVFARISTDLAEL